jgi:putative FmdB family regulatory protein
MPIYEYRCEGCGTDFEKRVQRAADGTSVKCPSCGENHLTLRLSTFAARAAGPRKEAVPPCASGVCPHPEMCGRN